MSIARDLLKLAPNLYNKTVNLPEEEKIQALLTLIDVDLPEELCRRIDKYLIDRRQPSKKLPDYNIMLYCGDITLLEVDAIVNAANKDMMGCYNPAHKCIDNVIHSKAGPRLRMECRQIIRRGKLNPIITKGYCLPCKYVIHVAGPIYDPHEDNSKELADCYRKSLNLARKHNLKNIAFCCISTGLYGYPKREAAQVAINTVKSWMTENDYPLHVVFAVYTEEDKVIYKDLTQELL